MVSITTSSPHIPQADASSEKRVALSGIAWQGYQDIISALPKTRAARLMFDNGTFEISMPLEIHEQFSEWIGLFIRILVVEMGLKLKSIRSTRLERKDLNRGAEPDNAYYIQSQPLVAGHEVDLATDLPYMSEPFIRELADHPGVVTRLSIQN